jgi:small subunit ribosomal protein S1
MKQLGARSLDHGRRKICHWLPCIRTVVSLTDYGAFVELEEGIEGLIHVSEMSWTRKVRHPNKIVAVGEEVDAVVLDLKPDNRRISLGMKQAVPNPWDVISDKYPVGTTIEGKIQKHHRFRLVHRH